VIGRAARRAIFLTAVSVAASGCFLFTSKSTGDELERRTNDQEQRLAALEEGARSQRQELADEVRNAKTKVTELEDLLERATKAVTRNSADVTLEVQRLGEQLGRLEGEIATLRQELEERQREAADTRREIDQRINAVAQKAGLDIELAETDIPADKAEHYATAYRAYQNNEMSRARALFRAYIQRYPQDEESDNALYWVGKSYLRQERPASALGEFRRVIADYSRGDALDETLFDMADAFYQLQACTDARSALQALIRSHPRSQLVQRARTKLREIERAPRGYCRT
jgi:TolA-binding protein